MPKTHTLTDPRDFRRVISTGRLSGNGGLALYVAARDDGGPARVGLAVKSPRAVTRNRIKRRLRAAWAEVEAPAGVDAVVRAEGDVITRDYQDIVGHLRRALHGQGRG